jgi:hypothetical protein
MPADAYFGRRCKTLSRSAGNSGHLTYPHRRAIRCRRVLSSTSNRPLIHKSAVHPVEWRNECGPVEDDDRIVELDSGNFRNRHFEPIVKLAGLPLVDGSLCRPKDLRDTYASHLLSANIPLPYVSKQLGHGDVLTTARHYARWIDASGRYVAPPSYSRTSPPARQRFASHSLPALARSHPAKGPRESKPLGARPHECDAWYGDLRVRKRKSGRGARGKGTPTIRRSRP